MISMEECKKNRYLRKAPVDVRAAEVFLQKARRWLDVAYLLKRESPDYTSEIAATVYNVFLHASQAFMALKGMKATKHICMIWYVIEHVPLSGIERIFLNLYEFRNTMYYTATPGTIGDLDDILKVASEFVDWVDSLLS